MAVPVLLLQGLVLVLLQAGGEAAAPVVRLREGRVSGKVLATAGGRQYFAYLGIPYAKPPVGDLRFKFPRGLKEDEWEGVLACTKDPPKCPQLSYPERIYEGDEDCLYLNVYTHRVEDTSQPMEELVEKLRPVLVWLHGGNFQHGSGNFDDVGPERFMENEEDLVLVVPNFRLNALGFLSIGEHPAVGNAGLKDQFRVLTWVHANIASFGGHPGKTTLGGFQSGGAAAHLHALSPLSSSEPNMFAQTLSLSGSALSPWAVLPTEEATRRAVKLARVMGCVKSGQPDSQVSAPELVRCLRTKSAEDIVRKCESVQDWFTDISFPFVPSVERFDGHNRPFMVTAPLTVLQNKMPGLAAKTWVTGVTTHDGLPQSLQLMVFKGMLHDLNEHFEERVWNFLGLAHLGNPELRRRLGQRLKDFYLPGNESIALDTISGIIDMTSDALYHHSMHRAVQLHSAARKAPVLVYRFGFDRHESRKHILGVPLGTDSELLFPANFAGKKSDLTEDEAKVSKKMLHLFTNYINLEDPTPEKELLLDNVEWPPATGADFSFLDIGLDGLFTINSTGFRTENMHLWKSIFEEIEDGLLTRERKKEKQVEKWKDEL